MGQPLSKPSPAPVVTGNFGIDMAHRIQEKVAGVRKIGKGVPHDHKPSKPKKGGNFHSDGHGQAEAPGKSDSITGPDPIVELARTPGPDGRVHMVQIEYTAPPPKGTVPRVQEFRHGIRMNAHNRWEVILDPDQSVHPYTTERSLHTRHWWDAIRLPTHPSDIGTSLMSMVQAGLDAGHSLVHTLLFNIQDLNHHLTMGWDNTVGGLTKWVHILWRAVVIGAILYGVVR